MVGWINKCNISLSFQYDQYEIQYGQYPLLTITHSQNSKGVCWECCVFPSDGKNIQTRSQVEGLC